MTVRSDRYTSWTRTWPYGAVQAFQLSGTARWALRADLQPFERFYRIYARYARSFAIITFTSLASAERVARRANAIIERKRTR